MTDPHFGSPSDAEPAQIGSGSGIIRSGKTASSGGTSSAGERSILSFQDQPQARPGANFEVGGPGLPQGWGRFLFLLPQVSNNAGKLGNRRGTSAFSESRFRGSGFCPRRTCRKKNSGLAAVAVR